MTGELTFVDTNVLVYAYDADAGAKHDKARSQLEALWHQESGRVSSRAPGVLRHRDPQARPANAPSNGSGGRRHLRAWPVHQPDFADLLTASELEERHQLSFWDALIVVSARRPGARSLLTEDLQDGQRFDGLEPEVVSPFRNPSAEDPSPVWNKRALQ